MLIEPLSILIVEDQQLIREGLVALLSLESDLSILGEADNGQVALDFLAEQRPEDLPDIALMDMRMPVMDGIAATQLLSQQYPTIKVLVLTTFDDDELIAQAMAAGAKGYLLKDTPSEELAMAIRSVAKGYSQFGPGIVQKMIGALPQVSSQASSQLSGQRSDPLSGPMLGQTSAQIAHQADAIAALTPREKEVLIHIGQGASNREIAQALYLSEGTVKNHVTRILSQLELRDRTQAALFAQSHQLCTKPINKFPNNQQK